MNGIWKTALSARNNGYKAKYFARWCGENDVRELSQLTPDRWNSYLLRVAESGTTGTSQRAQLGVVRQILRRYPHRLHPDMPKYLDRRLPSNDSVGSQPFPMDIYNAILKAARAAVDAEYQRIHPNLVMLERRLSGTLSRDKSEYADALHQVATTGAPQTNATRAVFGIPGSDRPLAGGVSPLGWWGFGLEVDHVRAVPGVSVRASGWAIA